jgi:hypothetical protein
MSNYLSNSVKESESRCTTCHESVRENAHSRIFPTNQARMNIFLEMESNGLTRHSLFNGVKGLGPNLSKQRRAPAYESLP